MLRVRKLLSKPTAYLDVLALQRGVQERLIIDSKAGTPTKDTLLLTEHRPVFTLGRNSRLEHVTPGIDVVRTERGGEVTYHGPGQLTAYPILNLGRENSKIKKDLHVYLRTLEEVVIRTLAEFGLKTPSRLEGLSGVWVGERKICAVGLSVKRWTTMHGVSLNVNSEALDGLRSTAIVPCGLEAKGVTCLEDEVGARFDLDDVANVFARHLVDLAYDEKKHGQNQRM